MSATRAGIYTRISSDVGGDGLGVARQERECRALADKLKVEVVGTYSDNDVSAYAVRSRPEYIRLLADVEAGRLSLIIAMDPDRLYRRQRDLMQLIDTVESAGADITTVTAGGLDLSSASGRMLARVVGAVAEHESDHKGERVSLKHDELARHGRWPGGGVPFGFRRVGVGHLEVESGEATLVREAARRILSGETVTAVCRDFNNRGLTSKQGLEWQRTGLKRVLTNPTITGKRRWRGQMLPAGWDALIDEQTFSELCDVLDTGVRRRRPRAVALFVAGVIRCGICDSPLRSVNTRGNRTTRLYSCKAAPDGRGCGQLAIDADLTERFVVQLLIGRVCTGGGEGTLELLGYGMTMQEQLRQNRRSRRELAMAHGRGELSRSEWDAVRRTLDRERRSVLAPARSGKLLISFGDVPPRAADAMRAWNDLSMTDRRTLVSTVIERVVIAPVRGGAAVSSFATERVLAGLVWVDDSDS